MSDWLWQTVGPRIPDAFHGGRPLVSRSRVERLPVGDVLKPAVSQRIGSSQRGNGRASLSPAAKREVRHATALKRPRTRRLDILPESLSERAGLEALYRVTRRQLSSVFFYPGSLESRALSFLSEPDEEESQRILDQLRSGVLTNAHESLYQLLCSADEGKEPRRLAWSSHPCADALRTRYLARRPPAADTTQMTWYGALRWAGHRALDRDDLADVPPNARKCVALAVASAAGYRRAVELLPWWFPDGPPTKPSVKRWSSLLVMRAAIEEKRFVPETVPYLVPPVGSTLRRKECIPVTAAFRCAVRERHEGGTVFLLAAILTMVFRCSLTKEAKRRHGFGIDLPAWGCGGVGAGDMRALAPLLALLADSGWRPWEEPVARRVQELLRVDLDAIQRRLMTLLGDARPPAFWFMYLDDAVLNASLFTLFGNTLSARLHLRSAKPQTSTGLQYRLERVSGRANEAESVWSILEPSTRGLTDSVEDLLKTPDPNVVLGTPIWALDERLGKIAPLALKDGRMKSLSAVRAMFHRPELRARLAPFWLLGKSDVRNVRRGLVWLGTGQPHPSEDEWLEFLELLAEEASKRC